jgi:hypothetical protein
MSISPLFRRGVLAAALAVALSGAALAAETLETETRVQLRTASGAIESLELDELAVGEVKAITAESGTTVIASRGADGYLLEVGKEEFKLPDFDAHALDADVHAMHGGGRHVEVHRHVAHGGAKDAGDVEKRVIVRKSGDGIERRVVVDATAGAEAVAELEAIEQAVAEAAGEGLPQKRVVVRKHLLGEGESLADIGFPGGAMPSLADPGNEGKRILVMRKVRHEKTKDAP